MSSFKSLNLFGSGPHRFSQSRQGQLVLPDYVLGLPGGGSTPQGLVELEVVVRGRLVAASESGLWSLRDAVAAQVIDPPTPGTLVDNSGRSYTGMSLISYEEADRVDRGRVWSVAYKAVFRRF